MLQFQDTALQRKSKGKPDTTSVKVRLFYYHHYAGEKHCLSNCFHNLDQVCRFSPHFIVKF